MKNKIGLPAILLAGVTLVVSGCNHLVHRHDFDMHMDGLRAQVEAAASQSSENAAGLEELRGAVAALREAVDQLASDFGGHVADDDQHRGLSLSLPVHFDFDSSDIRAVDRPLIDAFAEGVLGAYPAAHVTVEGFADSSGTAAYNMRLSQARADAVRDHLVQAGFSEDQVRTAAMGETRLVSDNTGVNDSQSGIENRRVTFVLEWAGPGN